MQNVLFVVLALVLVALNGFFVAAEFGIVTLRKTRVRAIAKAGGLRGRILFKVHSQLDAYLSACQLGITLASLGLGWVGEPAFARILEPMFVLAGVTSEKIIHGVSFVIAFGVISFLHIVVGELAPKSLAIRIPEKVGLWSALPLYGFYWAMYPAIWLLNASANLVLRIAGLSGAGGHETHYSNEELKMILRTGTSMPGEKFTHDERHILAQSLEFSQHSVADLMRPINEVSALYASRSLEDNLDTMRRNRFSRYPYFDEEGEEVLGVIHLKDLFLAEQSGKDVTVLSEYLRPVETISARTPAQDLFRRFRTGAPHFALIGEKGKRPVGFITLDNLLGEEQVLQVDHAQHFLAFLVEIGVAREAVAAHGVEVFLDRQVLVQGDDFVNRAHQVGHGHFREFQRLGQDVALVVGELFLFALFTGGAGVGTQDHLEFFVRVVGLVPAGAGEAGHAQHHVGAGVQQPDRRVHRPVEAVQRQRTPQADRLRGADRQRLRRQFAHHDVQEGDHAERDHEGHAVDQLFVGDAEQGEGRFEDAGKSRFADPAQAQRGQGDAQLAGRQIGVELAMDFVEDAAAQAAAFRNRAHAGFAKGDDAEFGRHEEAVQRHQEQGQNDE